MDLNIGACQLTVEGSRQEKEVSPFLHTRHIVLSREGLATLDMDQVGKMLNNTKLLLIEDDSFDNVVIPYALEDFVDMHEIELRYKYKRRDGLIRYYETDMLHSTIIPQRGTGLSIYELVSYMQNKIHTESLYLEVDALANNSEDDLYLLLI